MHSQFDIFHRVKLNHKSIELIIIFCFLFPDEWSRTDVKSAHHSVLKDGTRKVILILLGDLPSRDLDPDIRLLLKNHTHLNCEDKQFWQKLRFALPDVKVKIPLQMSRQFSRSLNGGRFNSHNNSNSSYHIHNQQQNPVSNSLGRHKQIPLPPIPIPPSVLLHHQQLQMNGGPQIPSQSDYITFDSVYSAANRNAIVSTNRDKNPNSNPNQNPHSNLNSTSFSNPSRNFNGHFNGEVETIVTKNQSYISSVYSRGDPGVQI